MWLDGDHADLRCFGGECCEVDRIARHDDDWFGKLDRGGGDECVDGGGAARPAEQSTSGSGECGVDDVDVGVGAASASWSGSGLADLLHQIVGDRAVAGGVRGRA